MSINGGYIGHDATPTAGYAADGVWGVRDVYTATLRNTWSGNDPYFSNVAALLPFNGEDGSTVFTDIKGHYFGANADAQLDTSNVVFGNASLLLDGSGDRIVADANTDWDLSTNDWTFEWWVHINTAATGSNGLTCRRSGGASGWAFDVTADGAIRFRAHVGGSWSDNWMTTATGVVPKDTTVFIGAKRSGDVFSIWTDGVQRSTFTRSGAVQDQSGYGLVIGAASNSGENSFHGWIDSWRFTKNVARDLSSVPTRAFPVR